MTVIDEMGYLYVMGGGDFDGQEVLNDVVRPATQHSPQRSQRRLS